MVMRSIRKIAQLDAFTHGQLQDALNILKIMERESLTIDDLKKYIQDVIFHPPQSRKGFMKRYSKAQRAKMLEHKGMEKRPCKRCDEKRRGKK